MKAVTPIIWKWQYQGWKKLFTIKLDGALLSISAAKKLRQTLKSIRKNLAMIQQVLL
jgi:hypothetical protein